MQQVSSVFGFLYDVHSLNNKTSLKVKEHDLNLEKALQHGDSKYIGAVALSSEQEGLYPN
ncbi:hypothetical protein DPMN_140789 [Dreissena polymorpha]|uniref:Uncharacterized protein n=1 Tax=Dreissena polymorpha TaxID=45954 RepID=A0A9D4JJB4_DREPO|nr:hypothetical protein DPMN_140789 [Dreissena polymorpha]